MCLFDLIVKLEHPQLLKWSYLMFLIDVLICKDNYQWTTLFQDLRTERKFTLEENISIFTEDLKVTATLYLRSVICSKGQINKQISCCRASVQ